jgi:ribonucleoside-diphosphate reductase alpha chain
MKVEEWVGQNNVLGATIWKDKYQHGDETFEQWLDRVSGGDKEVRKLIAKKRFLFGGRILANRGTGNRGTTSNCFTYAVEDSIESIYDCAKKMAQTYRAGGGVGVDISSLAPMGAKVNNSARTTSGAVSFIDVFTTTAGVIGVNGRRSALMVSISCDHPDVDEFIKLKTDINKATTANLSIRVSDDFMKAVENDEDWFCAFTRKETGECISKVFKAKELFQLFCDANYDYGEPGLLFWDTIQKYNMLVNYPDFKYCGVNPCGELPLPDGGACLLGSMNLAEYVKDNQFDIETFKIDVATAITALDTVQKEGIDLLPLDANKKVAKDWRPLGLGIMGLGDMLIKMNIPYGSPQSLTLCESIADAMATAAIKQSMKIGEESGSFPKFNAKQTASSPFYILHMGETPIKAMSNAQLLAIAPNGSIATMLGITGGIEPLYALEYDRTTKSLHGGEVSYKVIPTVVQEARDKGYVDGLVCSADIDYKARIDMQSIWQHHFDNSISSTVNLPHDFPREDVGELYKYAWKTGLKGITIFRDGCKRAGILTTDKSAPEEHEIVGVRRTVRTGCGNLHIIGMFDRESGALSEIFLAKGSNGGCLSFMTGLSRMISLSARNGASLESIIDQLSSCPTCPSYAVRRATEKDTAPGNCCPSAIGKALVEMSSEVKGFNLKKKRIDNSKKVTNPCPQCGAELVYTNGCRSCPECAWSKCD